MKVSGGDVGGNCISDGDNITVTQTFLSWDCAYKTLAHIHLTVNHGIYDQLYEQIELYKNIMGGGVGDSDGGDNKETTYHEQTLAFIRNCINLCKNYITFHSWGVNDILDGEKVDNVSMTARAKLMKKFLTNSAVACGKIACGKIAEPNSSPVTVLIEKQPDKIVHAANNKSAPVSHQIAFYYSDFDPICVDPKLKNKITIMPGYEHSVYVGRYEKAYNARKTHTKESFIKYLSIIKRSDILDGIKKSQLDDLADAFFQIFGYLNHYTEPKKAVGKKAAKVKEAKVKVKAVVKVNKPKE